MSDVEEGAQVPVDGEEIETLAGLLGQGELNKAYIYFNGLVDRPLPTDIEELNAFVEIGLQLNEAEYFYDALTKKYGDFKTIEAISRELTSLCAHLCFVTGRKKVAAEIIKMILENGAGSNRDYVNLASVLMSENYLEALPVLDRAITLFPEDARLYAMRADCMDEKGDHEAVIENCQKSISLTTDADLQGKAYYVLGKSYSQCAEKAKAIDNLERAMELVPLFGPAYFAFAQQKKFTLEDCIFYDRVAAQLEQSMPAKDRAFMCFALGKYFDDLGEYQKAFAFYKRGNELSKPAFKPEPQREIFNKIKVIFEADVAFEDWVEEALPVFVLGMPRSGSTLVEQIIATHTLAGSIGESAGIYKIYEKVFGHAGHESDPGEQLNYEALLDAYDNGSLHDWVENYLNRSRTTSEGCLRVVDKQPANYLFIGLIVRLFPQATILHTVRNTFDTCLSCYFQPFIHVPWSFDLSWIAEEYLFYQEVMTYWKSVLPENKVVDVNYEGLTNNFECGAKEVIAACGLPWEDECLHFYENKRRVKTASISQVKEPIYKTSQQRWKNYESYLAPLVSKLQINTAVKQKTRSSESSSTTKQTGDGNLFKRLRRWFSRV